MFLIRSVTHYVSLFTPILTVRLFECISCSYYLSLSPAPPSSPYYYISYVENSLCFQLFIYLHIYKKLKLNTITTKIQEHNKKEKTKNTKLLHSFSVLPQWQLCSDINNQPSYKIFYFIYHFNIQLFVWVYCSIPFLPPSLFLLLNHLHIINLSF